MTDQKKIQQKKWTEAIEGYKHHELELMERPKPKPKMIFEYSQTIITFDNLGNTCFLNSVIQAMIHSKQLRNFILSGQYSVDSTIWREFVNIVKTGCQGTIEMSPNALHEAFIYRKKEKEPYACMEPGWQHEQQDAEEAFTLLVNAFHEAILIKGKAFVDPTPCNDSDKRKLIEESIRQLNRDMEINREGGASEISKMFLNQWYERVQCLQCKRKNRKYPFSYHFALPMINTSGNVDIYDLLKNNSRREHMTGEEAYHCEDCCQKCSPKNGALPTEKCTKTDGFKKVGKIFRPADNLVIKFQRFKSSYNPSTGTIDWDKDEKFVDYPLTGLDLTNWVKYPGHPRLVYKLRSIVFHIGSTPHGGHYRAGSLINNRWVILDDSKYSIVGEHQMKKIVNNEAVLLFYEKIEF
tara:strand:- start:3155 stop:4381 length:1227 start_codon:yes stop_codon:yes gene_type:complete